MPWSRIDDNFYDHPKVEAAGPLGIAMFVCGLSYCARYLTDGFIQTSRAKRLIDIDDPLEVAERLVEVGLWERTDGGYLVHDYLDYNPSAAQVKADREANARRQAGWRKRQVEQPEKPESNGGSDDVSNGDSNAVTNDTTNPAPVPDPVPDPVPNTKNTGANAPEKPPPKRTRNRQNQTPEAIKVFRASAHRYPAKSWWDDVANAIGTEQANLDFWGEVVKAYVGLGWNPTNVKKMLEYYRRREIPDIKPPSQRPSKGLDASKEAFKGFLANHGIDIEDADGLP